MLGTVSPSCPALSLVECPVDPLIYGSCFEFRLGADLLIHSSPILQVLEIPGAFPQSPRFERVHAANDSPTPFRLTT